jgi:hypothetical protein
MVESITNDPTIYHAIAIDSTHFFYLCPHDKKICPSLVHFHGSSGNTESNRVESRGSHCPAEKNGVDIHITPGTLRKTLAIRGNSITFKKYKNKK